MMAGIQITTFGGVNICLDGKPVSKFPSRKAEALLIFLTVEKDIFHRRESLFTLLWPGMPERSARHNLRQVLYSLRQNFPDIQDEAGNPVPFLLTDRKTVQLNPQALIVADVHQFDALLDSTSAHDHSSLVGCQTCISELEIAVDLYQGDFLVDFYLEDSNPFEDWAQAVREAYRRKALDALSLLTDAFIQRAAYTQAQVCTDRQLQLDPLRETAYCQLMLIQSRDGHRAEALRTYQRLRQIFEAELDAQPSPETHALYEQIRVGPVVTIKEVPSRSHLPAQSTPFIGRQTELAEIRAKLTQDDCRLLTLVGPGGSGKTRLALQTAADSLEDYEHGVFFVSLAPVQQADDLPSAISGVLNFSFSRGSAPGQQLLAYLGERQVLLVLDNFEHLIAGAAFVDNILTTAPGVKIMATSRTRLMTTGEYLYPVTGMAYPESSLAELDTLHQYSAVRLFETGAVRVAPAFKLTEENFPDVIRICSLVAGMPLGIVLAASWVLMLSPAEIKDELARDLAFLDAELADLPRRQRSLRTVFEHSWRLLTEREQETLFALSVFRGGFTKETSRKIAGASLGDLMGLAQKSFLHRETNGRFEIHELLRQYAAEKLGRDPSAEERARDQHSKNFCRALAAWEHDLEGPRQGTAIQELMAERDNIQVAWAWAVEKGKTLRLMAAIQALGRFYTRLRLPKEGEKACRMVVEKLTPNGNYQDTPFKVRIDPAQVESRELLAKALIWGGCFKVWSGGAVGPAKAMIQDGLVLVDHLDIPPQDRTFLKAGGLNALSFAVRPESNREATRLLEESLALFRSIDAKYWIGVVLENLGYYHENREAGQRFLEESLAVYRELGNLRGIANNLICLSELAGWSGQFERAEDLVREAPPIYKELLDRQGIVVSYYLLGSCYAWQGEFDRSRSMYRKALDLYPDLESTITLEVVNAHSDYPDLYLGAYQAVTSSAGDKLVKWRDKYPRFAFPAHPVSILGRAALAQNDYPEALHRFQEALLQRADRYLEEQNNIGQTHACLGFAFRGMEQISEAQNHFLEALGIGIEVGNYLSVVHALPGIALLYADQGEIKRAVELYALAATQGIVANSPWFEDIAGAQIAEIATGLPPQTAAAARVSGRTLDLWETAQDLLEELKGMGWDCSD